MCDTLGFTDGNTAYFGKNSDRSPNEPQVLEYIPAGVNSENEVRLTYITVPQVKDRHAVLLSRPVWLWGAEIGVNDCGVCIGNEAVWTLGKYGKEALTGMDMLRLALERSDSAASAVDVITSLLESYGQGGNCGYDHEFFYDNSFLILDRENLLVLETAGKEWVYKKYERASISNRLSIGSGGDKFSGQRCNFSLRHSEHVYNIASGSSARRKSTNSCIADASSIKDIMSALRVHNNSVDNPFASGSVGSPCMHFGGLVGDHMTASMAVRVEKDKTAIFYTGSSCPCVSLYKPWIFGSEAGGAINIGSSYWYERETFLRSLLGKRVPDEYFAERDALEKRWMNLLEDGCAGLGTICLKEEKDFYDRWSKYSFENAGCSAGFKKRWSVKNTVFEEEMLSSAK